MCGVTVPRSAEEPLPRTDGLMAVLQVLGEQDRSVTAHWGRPLLLADLTKRASLNEQTASRHLRALLDREWVAWVRMRNTAHGRQHHPLAKWWFLTELGRGSILREYPYLLTAGADSTALVGPRQPTRYVEPVLLLLRRHDAPLTTAQVANTVAVNAHVLVKMLRGWAGGVVKRHVGSPGRRGRAPHLWMLTAQARRHTHDELLALVARPSAVRVLAHVARGPASVDGVARALDLPERAVSDALMWLRSLRFVTSTDTLPAAWSLVDDGSHQ